MTDVTLACVTRLGVGYAVNLSWIIKCLRTMDNDRCGVVFVDYEKRQAIVPDAYRYIVKLDVRL